MHLLRLTAAIVATVVVVAAKPKHHTDPAAKYRINTAKLPGLDKDLADLPQWSGEMPVGGDNTLFFWYTQAKDAKNDNLIFWHNGGPGCSSMEGLFEENGPYRSYDKGKTWKMNPHSWHNVGHMVYIDQPFGTGFSTNQTEVPNEDFVGNTMIGFYENFFKAFPEMRKKNMYITGESYAGMYIPYIAKHVLQHNEKKGANKINLKAITIGDGCVANGQIALVGGLEYLITQPWTLGNNATFIVSASMSRPSIDPLSCTYARINLHLTICFQLGRG